MSLAQEFSIKAMVIPTYASFDFNQDRVVEMGLGDIDILPYGIERATAGAEVSPLRKGFIEDIKSLPDEEEIEWDVFADFQIGMIYAVRCANKKFALVELIDVKVSENEIVGIEIKYNYQPDGTRNFN